MSKRKKLEKNLNPGMKKVAYGQLLDKTGRQLNENSSKKQKIDYGEDFDTDDEDVTNELQDNDKDTQVYHHTDNTQGNSEMYIEAEMSDQDIPDEIECQLIQKTIYINRMPTTVEFIMCNQCPRLFRTENLLWNHIKASHLKRKRLYQNLIATASKFLMQRKPSFSSPGTANHSSPSCAVSDEASYSADDTNYNSDDNIDTFSSQEQQSDTVKQIDLSSLNTKMIVPEFCALSSPVSQQSLTVHQTESQNAVYEEIAHTQTISHYTQENEEVSPPEIHIKLEQSIEEHHQQQEQPSQIQQYQEEPQHQPQLHSPEQQQQIVFQIVDVQPEGEGEGVVNMEHFDTPQDGEVYNYIVGLDKSETQDTTENVINNNEDDTKLNSGDSVTEFRCFRSPCTGLEAFTTVSSCDLHVTKVHTPKPDLQECDICDRQFANLTKHKESVHKMFKSFSCDHCQKEYCSEQDLERHLSSIERVADTEEVVVQEIDIELGNAATVEDCDKVDNPQAKEFLKKVQSQVFPCKECGWSTQSRTEYIQHVLDKCDKDPSIATSKHVIINRDGQRNHILVQQDADMGKAVRQVLAFNKSAPQDKHILGIKKRQLGLNHRQPNPYQKQFINQMRHNEEAANMEENTITIENIAMSTLEPAFNSDQNTGYKEDTSHINDSNENSNVLTQKRLIHIVEDENGKELMQLVRTTDDNQMIHINTTDQIIR